MKRFVGLLLGLFILQSSCLDASGEGRTEEILKEVGSYEVLDDTQLDELLGELAEGNHKQRKAAMQAARELDSSSLGKLIEKLASSDDPELARNAERLRAHVGKQKTILPTTVAIMRKALSGDAEAQGYLSGMFRRPEGGLPFEPDEAIRWARASMASTNAMGLYAMAQLYWDGVAVELDRDKAGHLLARAAKGVAELAENGSAMAQCNYAWMLRNGLGVPQDKNAAFEWCHKAATSRYPRAEYYLARLYDWGIGTDQDPKETMKWARKSFEHGWPDGGWLVGVLHYKGNGVPQDVGVALEWYIKAAEAGSGAGCYEAGFLNEKGTGIPVDAAAAAEWYQKGVKLGNRASMNNLAILYKDGNGVKMDFEKAIDLYNKATQRGSGYAAYNLASAYHDGTLGLKQDMTEAVKWYKLAAAFEHAISQCKTAYAYRNGEGIEKNILEASRWYSKSASNGHVHATYNLGLLFTYGHGGHPTNALRAIELFKEAADGGEHGALDQIGWIYHSGIAGGKKDPVKAFKWYQKGVNKGLNWSNIGMGELYENGEGVRTNLDKAVSHYLNAVVSGSSHDAFNHLRKVAEKGNSKAQLEMGRLSWKGIPNQFSFLGNEAIEIHAWDDGPMFMMETVTSSHVPFLKVDTEEALYWLNLAAAQGNKAAASDLKELRKSAALTDDKEKSVEKRIEWVKELRKELADIKKPEKVWQLGHLEAMVYLGMALKQGGETVEKKPAAAVKWFSRSASLGHLKAISLVAQAYSHGTGVDQDFATAEKWLKKGADQEDAACYNALAWLYATCRDEKMLDGELAVAYANKALSDEPENGGWLDTLAAAYARNGGFALAAKAQQDAIDAMAGVPMGERFIPEMKERLELYRAQKPYVETLSEEEPEETRSSD